MNKPECFVAMWFGSDNDSEDEMNQLYELVIKPAIEEQGLSPYQVGKDPKADKLDEAILGGIDRAVLVVVDLTHDPNTGWRGNVVFEAGYAYQTKPIIWMCRDDLADSTPFDFRQFRQIRWNRNRLTEAKKQLADVIGKRIGALQISKADHEISRLIAAEWGKIMATEDITLETGNVFSHEQIRFTMFQELCDDIRTRVKYKEMGLSQAYKYELIEMVRGFSNLIGLFKSKDRVFGDENYTNIIYPRLRASGWLKSE